MRLLIVARFVNRAGAFALPFLTLWLTREFGASLQAAGLVVAAFGLASMASRLLGGRLADRWGRRPTIAAGLLGCATALAAMAGSSTLGEAIAAVVLLGLSFEIYEPASQALIADGVEPVDRPAAFGMLGASLSAAALVAGLLATILAPESLRLLFVADSATCLASADRRTEPAAEDRPPEHLAAARTSGRSPWHDPTFVFLFTTNTVFAACYLQVFVTLPFTLRSHAIGPGGLARCSRPRP